MEGRSNDKGHLQADFTPMPILYLAGIRVFILLFSFENGAKVGSRVLNISTMNCLPPLHKNKDDKHEWNHVWHDQCLPLLEGPHIQQSWPLCPIQLLYHLCHPQSGPDPHPPTQLDNPSAHRLVRWCCSCSVTLLAGRILSAGASDTQSFIVLSGSMRCVDGHELQPERRVPATIMDAATFGAKKGWTDAEDDSAIMGVSSSLSSYHSISEASFEAAIMMNSTVRGVEGPGTKLITRMPIFDRISTLIYYTWGLC